MTHLRADSVLGSKRCLRSIRLVAANAQNTAVFVCRFLGSGFNQPAFHVFQLHAGRERAAGLIVRRRGRAGIGLDQPHPQVAGSQVWVPARVYRSSGLEDRTYLLVADSSVGALRICEGG